MPEWSSPLRSPARLRMSLLLVGWLLRATGHGVEIGLSGLTAASLRV